MSKSKKPRPEEHVREKEPPAHRIRRETNRQIEGFVGVIDEAQWDDDEEITTFEKFKKKKGK